jgi:hypothetical protein
MGVDINEKQLTCDNCGNHGHARRTCPQKSSSRNSGGRGGGQYGGRGGGYAHLVEEIDDFDPSGPEPSQPSADWYAQRDAHFHDDVYDECVTDDAAVTKKRKRDYFSSAFSILLMVFFFFQLIYTVTCFLYNFETIKFDFSTFSTFCPMLVQIFYVLSTKNFVAYSNKRSSSDYTEQ